SWRGACSSSVRDEIVVHPCRPRCRVAPMSGPRILAIALLVACGAPPGEPARDPDASTDAPLVDAAPCGLRTGQRGKTVRDVTIDGLRRTYIVYLPDTVDPTRPMPLVFVHHGYTMSAEDMFDLTR